MNGLSAASINPDRNAAVAIGSGIGLPLGGLGNGYSVFGRYGFLRQNFDSTPDAPPELYPHTPAWRRLYRDNPALPCDYAFLVSVDGTTYVLSEVVPDWLEDAARPVTGIEVEAKLPKGLARYRGIPGLELTIGCFSPLIPGDVETSSVPAQIFDLAFVNTGGRPLAITLQLRHRCKLFPEAGESGTRMELVGLAFEFAGGGPAGEAAALTLDPHGQTAFAIAGAPFDEQGPRCAFTLAPGKRMSRRAAIAWHYPYFKTPSPAATQIYRRHYAGRFADAAAVMRHALSHADEWSRRIDDFHARFDFPGAFTRLWFGSLSSLITGSMLADTGEYFEIETPHYWVNTMDVSAYSGWAVMLLYPELEQADMAQFTRVIPRAGEDAGFVWHSLWSDACHYAEEPTFMVRYARDFFFFRDREKALADWELLTLVMLRQLRQCNADGLFDSPYGNQSYDAWKMPGVGMYVNTAWIYALYSYGLLAGLLGRDGLLDGVPAGERAVKAAAALDRTLWNPASGSWKCFSASDAVFSDQLFGRWMLAILHGCAELLPEEHTASALETVYANNLVTAPDGFRGWANGMHPGRIPEMASYHARTCWLGAQLDFASLLALYGREDRALDVYASIEKSLFNDHLAVGEWNRAVDADGKARPLAEEPGKDTGHFPSYPRYKSAWESLPRLLGLTLDWENLYLAPFKSLDFELGEWPVAGERLAVRVEKDWRHCRVDGQPARQFPVTLRRGTGHPYKVEFLR